MSRANLLQYLAIIAACIAIATLGWWWRNWGVVLVFATLAAVFVTWFVRDWWETRQ